MYDDPGCAKPGTGRLLRQNVLARTRLRCRRLLIAQGPMARCRLPGWAEVCNKGSFWPPPPPPPPAPPPPPYDASARSLTAVSPVSMIRDNWDPFSVRATRSCASATCAGLLAQGSRLFASHLEILPRLHFAAVHRRLSTMARKLLVFGYRPPHSLGASCFDLELGDRLISDPLPCPFRCENPEHADDQFSAMACRPL